MIAHNSFQYFTYELFTEKDCFSHSYFSQLTQSWGYVLRSLSEVGMSLSDLKLANSRFLLFYFLRPNKRHIYATPLRSSYFVWLHYKWRYFPQSIPPMWLCLSVLQFVPRPGKTLVSVCVAGTEGVVTINVVQKSTCLNWMEQHISSPTHSKCLYLSFSQSRHVLLETVLNSDTSQNYSPAKSPAQILTGKCKKKENPAVKI